MGVVSKHKPIEKSRKLGILNLKFVLGVMSFPNLPNSSNTNSIKNYNFK